MTGCVRNTALLQALKKPKGAKTHE